MEAVRRTLFALAALIFTAQTHAVTISSAGDTWTVDWSTTTVSGYDLSSTSTWTVDSFTDTAISLTIDITNTTLLSGSLTNADILSFGFGIDPNATATILTAGSTFDMVSAGAGPQQTFPGGFKAIDVCIYASGCSGGTTFDGLRAGETDTIQILLSGDFSSGFAELLFFPLKFQTSDGSYEPAGCVDGKCPRVPEPSVPALLGIGLLMMVLVRNGALRAARLRG